MFPFLGILWYRVEVTIVSQPIIDLDLFWIPLYFVPREHANQLFLGPSKAQVQETKSLTTTFPVFHTGAHMC